MIGVISLRKQQGSLNTGLTGALPQPAGSVAVPLAAQAVSVEPCKWPNEPPQCQGTMVGWAALLRRLQTCLRGYSTSLDLSPWLTPPKLFGPQRYNVVGPSPSCAWGRQINVLG